MRVLLILFPITMMVSEGLHFNVDFGSRLSSKNIIVVLTLLIIAVRMAREGRLRLELPSIHACFVVLIAYSVLSWFVAAFVVGYAGYPIFANAVFLKVLLLDRYLVFLAFFYGPRTESEVTLVLKGLLAVVIFAQVVTVGESLGVLPTHFVQVRETGRVFGLIGESNQFALFTALFLPGLLVLAAITRGPMRLFWVGGALTSFASFALTVSRGATVGAITSLVVGLYMFRRYVSPAVVLRWVAAGTAAFVTALVLVWGKFGYLIRDRVITDTFGQGGVSGASMGRTEIWLAAIDKMLEYPVTLLTGFGWRVYFSLPRLGAPHNSYLDYWFNLGLPGLFSFLGILLVGLALAYRAGTKADGPAAAHLRAFVFGLLTVIVGLTFTEWYEPWSYFWPYFGLALRLAVIVEQRQRSGVVSAVPPDAMSLRVVGGRASQRYGWSRSQ